MAAAVAPESLAWSDLTVIAAGGKVLLRRCAGTAAAGSLTAVLGSSGSGKTTLLQCLAGQLPRGSGLRAFGSVTINGARVHGGEAPEQPFKCAFVRQDEEFFSEMTVLETMRFRAALGGAACGRGDEPERILERMGLAKTMHQRVGGAKRKGLSGGERKRLSLGLELLSRPSLILCDEPTTGLDASQAMRVVEALRALADEGHTIVMSIHQPRHRAFQMFDQLLLLSEGDTCYVGTAAGALAHVRNATGLFDAKGVAEDRAGNDAEALIDLISIDYSSAEKQAQTQEVRDRIVTSWRRVGSVKKQYEKRVTFELDAGAAAAAPDAAAAPRRRRRRPIRGLFFQFRRLLARSFSQLCRDKATSITRLTTALSSACVFSSIYWKVSPHTHARGRRRWHTHPH